MTPPERIFWGQSGYHPEDQYLMEAGDLDKEALRAFAVQDIIAYVQDSYVIPPPQDGTIIDVWMDYVDHPEWVGDRATIYWLADEWKLLPEERSFRYWWRAPKVHKVGQT